MKGTSLGEFEEIVLLSVAILGDQAYGVSIKEEINHRLQRNPSIGALHAALNRLEDKGFLKSEESESTPERGGRRKLHFHITKSGIRTLEKSRDLRNSMWNDISALTLQTKKG